MSETYRRMIAEYRKANSGYQTNHPEKIPCYEELGWVIFRTIGHNASHYWELGQDRDGTWWLKCYGESCRENKWGIPFMDETYRPLEDGEELEYVGHY